MKFIKKKLDWTLQFHLILYDFFNYLKNNEHIDQDETILVRQLENTTQGMPLEIYCFTNDSNWENFEQIQADIFDHLLVASKEFDLEIMQVNKI